MSLFALASLALLCCPTQTAAFDPADTEFRVRDLAMGAPVQPADSWDWRERYRAMDGLGRRIPGQIANSEITFVRTCTSDEHPNVRASALAAYAHHRLGFELSMEALAADPMPEVRIQLARALGGMHTESAEAWLATLALDPDDDVARVGRAELFTRGPNAFTTQVTFLKEYWAALDPASFLQVLDVIDRANETQRLVLEVCAWLKRSDEVVAPADRVRRALWFTLHGASHDDASVNWLADQWLVPFPPRSSPRTSSWIDSRRRRRLERVELNEPHRSQLVAALLQRAEEMSRVQSPSDVNGIEARARASRAIEGAVSVHFAWRGGAPTQPFPIPVNWNAELEEELWGLCFGWADSWGTAATDVLDSTSEDVRAAAWNTLAETWSRVGRTPTQPWLERALADGFLAESVYRELVHSKNELAHLDLLHTWWARQAPDVRLDLLRDHWPGRRYEPWRKGLLDFWALQTDDQRTVLELLAGLEGDEDLAERLLDGVRDELEFLENAPVPDKEVIRGPWRDSESRARWQLEAWLKVQGPGHVAQRSRLLLRVAPLGKELGKTLVANLATSAEGLEALEATFSRSELSRRMRYEILLLHPGMEDERRIYELYLAYPHADEDLQIRILERAARGWNAVARALLLSVAGEGEGVSSLRFLAVASLAELGRSGVDVESELLGLLDGTDNFELQQVLIRALGATADDHQSLRFLERYDDDFERSMIGDELLAAMVKIELRACEAQEAPPALSKEVLSRWRAQPTDSATTELRSRFEGEGLAARNFVYSGWLDAARSMIRAGILEHALGDRWWTWDGRLLMRLAELVAEDPGTDGDFLHRLQQAALVAVNGEGPASDRAGILLRLRARLLAGELRARRWRVALDRVTGILADWRAYRVPASAMERSFGPTDAGIQVDPRTALLAIELECRVRLALAAGDDALIDRLRPKMDELLRGPSRLARERLQVLRSELED